MNYNLIMEQTLEEIKNKNQKPTLLLHVCCAPCSSACIERLQEVFKITLFFYNPNITEQEEYIKRVNEVKRFVKEFNKKEKIEVIDGGYDSEIFFKMAEGLENCEEKGPRCYKCYKLRLKKTAEVCKINNFDYFTTSLSLSPYKVVTWINEIGEELGKEYKINFLNCDFKKKNGYKRSIELSNEYKLYRQNYCGCIYSKNKSNNI